MQHPFANNKQWKQPQYVDLEAPSDISTGYQEVTGNETSSETGEPQNNQIPQHPVIQPMYMPMQGPNGLVYVPVLPPQFPPHGMPPPMHMSQQFPIQMPMGQIPPHGMYPGVPQGIPQGQVMFSYPVGPRIVEGPGIIEQIRGYFQGMNESQKRAFSLRIFGILCFIMLWMSLWRIGRIGSGSLVLIAFSIASIVNNCQLQCAIKCKNVQKLERGIKGLRLLSILSIYNLFLFIVLGGFIYLGFKWFIILGLYSFFALKNRKKLEKFRDEVVPLEWAQPC